MIEHLQDHVAEQPALGVDLRGDDDGVAGGECRAGGKAEAKRGGGDLQSEFHGTCPPLAARPKREESPTQAAAIVKFLSAATRRICARPQPGIAELPATRAENRFGRDEVKDTNVFGHAARRRSADFIGGRSESLGADVALGSSTARRRALRGESRMCCPCGACGKQLFGLTPGTNGRRTQRQEPGPEQATARASIGIGRAMSKTARFPAISS